jgi:predicted RNA-binding protein with PUA-like domain
LVLEGTGKGFGPPPVDLPVRRWLFKEEPSHYSFADLVRDRETEWDGVRNAVAVRNLRSMVQGDPGFYYHSGTERAIIGRLEVVRAAQLETEGEDPGWSVRVRAVGPLPRPVTLAELKASPPKVPFDLLRIGRLSVVEVPAIAWDDILARASAGSGQSTRESARGSRASAARRKRAGA